MGSIKWKMAALYMVLVVTVMTGCGASILYSLRSNAYEDAFKEVDYTAERMIDVLSVEVRNDWRSPSKIFGEVLTTTIFDSLNTMFLLLGVVTIFLIITQIKIIAECCFRFIY